MVLQAAHNVNQDIGVKIAEDYVLDQLIAQELNQLVTKMIVAQFVNIVKMVGMVHIANLNVVILIIVWWKKFAIKQVVEVFIVSYVKNIIKEMFAIYAQKSIIVLS